MSGEELRGRKGPHKHKRRKTKKTYCDIKFLCDYIQDRAEEAGLDVTIRTHQNVKLMYEAAAPILYQCVEKSQRSTQLKWLTLVSKLRKKLNDEKKAAKAAEDSADEDEPGLPNSVRCACSCYC